MTMMKIVLQLIAASTTLSLTAAFTSPIPHVSTINRSTSHSTGMPNVVVAPKSRGFGVIWRHMTSEDGNNEGATSSPRKPRRKRKDGKQFSAPSSAQSDDSEVETATVAQTEPTPEDAAAPAPPKPKVVSMQVRDVRDVVSGAPESLVEEDVEEEVEAEEDNDHEELADDEEWEYYDVDEDGNEINKSNEPTGRGQDDSIEQLLADARSMRSAEAPSEEEETSMKDAVFNVISTIVTVDFFVVIALLVWFLTGIFFSTVLGNDAVQIAFNMNFERVTQPALGILMIGSVAGALGNQDEEEEY
ncbi:hypothetical protein ACHAXR_005764 [Thalassiosira sp. AJA248-18]